MAEKYDVVALGELLMDMTNNGTSGQGNVLYEANPGGAPCNVLAMLKKLGHNVGFIGKVGDDLFGHELKGVLEEVGIGTQGLVMDKDVRTTLAFVKTFSDGDRDFSFYRNPGADMMLDESEVNTGMIENAKVFHFGTLSMTSPAVRKATVYALDKAVEAGDVISFDPNIREPLWDSMEEARQQVLTGLGYCDYLKISDNEIQWLTGSDDFTEGIKWILDRFAVSLITLSCGKDGSMAFYRKDPASKEYVSARADAFLQKNTIETTGAGDTFNGCILHYLCEKGIGDLTENDLKEMLVFANAAASIITTRRGALRVMPDIDEIKKVSKRTVPFDTF